MQWGEVKISWVTWGSLTSSIGIGPSHEKRVEPWVSKWSPSTLSISVYTYHKLKITIYIVKLFSQFTYFPFALVCAPCQSEDNPLDQEAFALTYNIYGETTGNISTVRGTEHPTGATLTWLRVISNRLYNIQDRTLSTERLKAYYLWIPECSAILYPRTRWSSVFGTIVTRVRSWFLVNRTSMNSTKYK